MVPVTVPAPNAAPPERTSESDAPATGALLVTETVTKPFESVVYTVPVVLVAGVTDAVPKVPDHVGVTVIAAAGVAVSAEVWT
jgi:hypothetical protein